MRIAQHIQRQGTLEPQALAGLAEVRPQLVLLFGPIEQFRRPDLLPTLTKTFPGAAIAGCSTAGEITAAGVHEGTCVITAVGFADTDVKVAAAPLASLTDSRAAGERLGEALAAPGLAGVLLFSKGVDVNGSALIEGLMSRVGAGIPVSGGLAGDNGAFKQTYVLSSEGVSDAAAIAIGLYGPRVIIGQGSFGGWEPFGPARKVTRADGNILYELDGEPALNIYKRYLGDYAAQLPASGLLFPFEMLGQDHSVLGLIRTILGIDEQAGSLTLAGAIDEGGYLRLMHASTDALVDGAETAARSAAAIDPAGPALALLVSCVGRKLVMGDQVDEEVEVVAESLGRDRTLAGFYSYGEINPMQGTLDCRLHNQTMTVALIAEG